MSAMYLSNYLGILNLVQKKPQLVHLIVLSGKHRLSHRFRRTQLNGWSHPPEQITIMVTDHCNLKCRMCQYAHSNTSGYQLNSVGNMDPKIFQKLMDEIPGHPMVSLTGGEPLLHPDIVNLISIVKAKGRLCGLTSNGWLLAKKAKSLSEAGLDILILSVDGQKMTHNQIRGKGSYERLIEGLGEILGYPDRPLVFLSMVISDLNYRELDQMYEFASKLGVDGLNFNHLWMQTSEMGESHHLEFPIFTADKISWEVHPGNINVEKLADSLEKIRTKNRGRRFVLAETPYLDRSEVVTWYQKPEQPVKWKSTRCAWIRMKVWPDGKVKPCRTWQVGNIAEQNAMVIWNNEHYQRFRKHLFVNGTLSICARCCYMAHR